MAKKSSKKPTTISHTNIVAFVVVALLLGWVLGYLIGASSEDDAAKDVNTSADTLASHKHDFYEVSEAEAPTIKVLADVDKLGGWNVSIITTNFEFTPEDVNEEDELGTGHAHIWVDGEKVGRVYGANYHLGSLGEGDHEITVTLNTNSHKDYAVGDTPVRDSVTVTEVTGSGDGHSSQMGSDADMSDEDSHMHVDGDDESHTHSN